MTIPDSPTTILFVDDNQADARFFELLVQTEPGLQFAGHLERADKLRDTVIEKKPSIVILDLGMPGKDPLVALAETLEAAPATKVIVCSGYDGSESVDRAFQAGARGYVVKCADPAGTLNAIKRVASGEL